MNYSLIKQLAAKKGVTIVALSKMIGYSSQGFHKSIRDQKLTIKALEDICLLLNTPISYFFDIQDNEALQKEIEALKVENKHLKEINKLYKQIESYSSAADRNEGYKVKKVNSGTKKANE